jgi:hypothetical protein
LVLSFGWLPWSRAWPVESPKLHIAVYVFNAAHVGSRDLAKAEVQAAEVFEKVGVKITWVTGLTAREAKGHSVGEAWNPSNLDLRIWTRPMARGAAIPSNALGYCLSMERGQAVVLSDAIQNLAAIWGTDAADILGLAMAHEIGHLLLRTGSHSAAGMMEPRYLQKDLASAERGSLLFTRKESNAMQNEVLRRTGIQISEVVNTKPGEQSGLQTPGNCEGLEPSEYENSVPAVRAFRLQAPD